MEYKDVRLFMKKGAEAIEILEGLGYEWGSYQKAPPKWEKVKQDPMQPVYDAVGKLFDDLRAPLIKQLEEMAKQAPLKAGDRFKVNPMLMPNHHKLKRAYGYERAVYTAREVELSSPHGYPVVRFGLPESPDNRGFWLALDAVIKL